MSATRGILYQRGLSKRYKAQPYSMIGIDRAHPLAQDLIFASLMSASEMMRPSMQNQITRQFGTMSNGRATVTKNGEYALTFNGSNTSGLQGFDLSPFRRTTWTYRLQVPAGIGNKVIFEYPNDYNSKNGMVVYTDTATSTLGFAVSNHIGASNTYQVKTMPLPPANSSNMFSLQIDRDDTGSNAIYGVFMNGQRVTLTLGTNSYGGLAFDNTAALYVGSRGGASLFFQGQLSCVLIHKKILRVHEILSLHLNPYQILLRQPFGFAGANMLGGFQPWRPLMTQVPIIPED